MTNLLDQTSAEERFRSVFAHLGAVTAYARRRGHRDAEAAAAEVMTIAWRRLADVPFDDPRPWLFATARNVVRADARRSPVISGETGNASAPEAELLELDPELASAIRSLSGIDREALLLVAWEDLTPTQAARSLGINPAAFRVRLLRARRRLQTKLDEASTCRGCEPNANLDMETT
jgi:RNA polymerase sigma factor (sigma-70 family)